LLPIAFALALGSVSRADDEKARCILRSLERYTDEALRPPLDLGLKAAVRAKGYRKKNELLAAAKATLPPEEFRKFEAYYYSHFFFSRDEIIAEATQEGRRIGPPTRYNKYGEAPFDGYLKAREGLEGKAKTDPLTIADIKAAQRALMSKESVSPESVGRRFLGLVKGKTRNSEASLDGDLGVIRDIQVGYKPMSESTGNGHVVLSDGTRLTASPLLNSELSQVNPLIAWDPAAGRVRYAELRRWKVFESRLSKGLRHRLNGLDKKSPDWLVSQGFARTRAELVRAMVTELLEDSLRTLGKSLKRAKTQAEVISAIASFQYDFISIHPFFNGNGRTGRLLAEALLERYGLPPPLWSQWGQDVALSRQDFIELFRDSVFLSARYHDDLAVMIESGLDYRLTPTPYLTRDKLIGTHSTDFAPEEFMAWVAATRKPAESVQDALLEFHVWKKKYEYSDGKGGVRFATPVFKRSFNRLSRSQEAFDAKMAEFYADKPVYRGLTQRRRPSNLEIVAKFAVMDGAVTGMGVPVGSPPEFFDAMFDRFNEQIATDPKKLNKTILAHTAGIKDGYYTSGFVSFSANAVIAENFANGHLMGAEYKAGVQARLSIEAMDRKVASVATDKRSLSIPKAGYSEEAERILLGGADPESITTVIVEDIDVLDSGPSGRPIEKAKLLRTRVARRTGFNTVQLQELDADLNLVRTEYYQIGPGRELILKSSEEAPPPL
jgi:hypothetical protein